MNDEAKLDIFDCTRLEDEKVLVRLIIQMMLKEAMGRVHKLGFIAVLNVIKLNDVVGGGSTQRCRMVGVSDC